MAWSRPERRASGGGRLGPGDVVIMAVRHQREDDYH
jgi:hypothetical protein